MCILFVAAAGEIVHPKTQVDTDPILPILYLITPTYYRLSQIPDLTRLANTLAHVKKAHWIVVEDAYHESQRVLALLNQSSITYTYLTKRESKKARASNLKGVSQRNAGIEWIRQHHIPTVDGVFYFADDDNTYSLELFEEMRKTRKVSIWPVGFAGGRAVETPKVENGKVVGFSAWSPEREFAVDMAGFALNVKVLFDHPNMKFSYNTENSFQETEFLQQCCTRDDLEPLADECTKILVWHTRTENPDMGFVKPQDVKHLMKFYA
ncbi:hypothetical protein KUTeg_021676 [Tegillarca granosa]|uniref:Galactosylgalactosylxylosylprotein 3-beta-glucuronosyltransferase n=1 Tax=Tegillarca granosa TaxID=220873 RepID=A0ABQ9E4F6_TEGGR|nr:hypothetical protein KUTeg_021676 [Tegillarca granosa]